MRRLMGVCVGAVVALGVTAPPAAADPLDGERVVVELAPDAAPAVLDEVVATVDGEVVASWDEVGTGFAAVLGPGDAAALRADPRVESVTPDQRVSIATDQTGAPWGLGRIDQRETAPADVYRYDTTGAGVTAYVIDTGVRFSHDEFEGRAVSGWDFVDGDADASDCHGHGTHVAGTIGGRTYGVAKDVRIVSLRVLDCGGSGWWSDIIGALDWASADRHGPAVANLSIGGGAYGPVNDAVTRAVASGLDVVVAAGNESSDACTRSPASATAGLTVAASDAYDQPAYFTNYGSCVDLYAPGVDVLSSTATSDTSSAYWSGTSMAAPHVAGAVARLLEREPGLTPADVAARLAADATHGAVVDPRTPVDDLLHAAPPAAVPPSAPASFAITGRPATAQATVDWTPPANDGGSAITGYRVSRDGTDSGGAGPWSTTVGADVRSSTFGNLVRGSTYALTVRAITAAGDGAAASGTITLPVSEVAGPPVSVRAVNGPAAGQGTVSWAPPTSTGGSPITGYRVSRDGTDSRGGGPWSTTVGADVRSFAFGSLAAGRTYTLTVQALTAVGAGSGASTTVTPPATAPSAPQGLSTQPGPSSAHRTITWAAPASDGGSPVTGYLVARDGTDSTGGGPWSTTLPADGRVVTFGNLVPGSTYTFTVRAINAVGTGATGTLKVTMPLLAPSEPTGVTATRGSASAVVRWTAPASTGGSAITGYRVRRYAGTGSTLLSTTTVAATARTTTVTGLTNGTAYSFDVTAINAVGTGTPSKRTAAVVPATTPGAPVIGTAVSGTAGGTITAKAVWSAPTSTGSSAVTGYQVSALRLSSTGAVLSTTTSALQPATARSLTMTLPATGSYRFVVKAVNAVGTGASSARSNAVTGR